MLWFLNATEHACVYVVSVYVCVPVHEVVRQNTFPVAPPEHHWCLTCSSVNEWGLFL